MDLVSVERNGLWRDVPNKERDTLFGPLRSTGTRPVATLRAIRFPRRVTGFSLQRDGNVALATSTKTRGSSIHAGWRACQVFGEDVTIS